MPKKLIIGISVAAVVIAGVVFTILLIRSRALTVDEASETSAQGTELPPPQASSGFVRPGGSQSATGGAAVETRKSTGNCGDGTCSTGESWCKPDCGSKEDRFLASIKTSDLTPTSFKLSWKTEDPSTGEVRYGTTERYELGTETSAEPKTSHEVSLEGLSPGGNYFVLLRVTEDGETREVPLFYETPASP